jgi:HPt (histidine-containing phosphotransfer) domain-containing protein
MLRRYARSAAKPAGGDGSSRSDGPIDMATLLRAVDHDRPILEELARLFRDQSVEQLAQLRAALDARDADAVRRIGHALKGGLATLFAKETVALAHEVEEAGRSGNLEIAGRVLPRLEEQVRAIPGELLDLARTLGDTEVG